MSQSTFERYENKYLITAVQYEALMQNLSVSMVPDQYGAYRIFNLYYDTEHFDLARASIAKPVYKEKLRLRWYGAAGEGAVSDTEDVPFTASQIGYLELKKKFNGIVYKRRIQMICGEAENFIHQRVYNGEDSQILREIKFFLSRYNLSVKVFLNYDRTAYKETEGNELRITFDTNICFRDDEHGLNSSRGGNYLLKKGIILMEIKTVHSMPLWLCRHLSGLGIVPVSFSKYNVCYNTMNQRRAHAGV
jgi:SPX domain protein involved in polyphosphate accumulation